MHRLPSAKPNRPSVVIENWSACRQAPVRWLVGAILLGSPWSAWADPWWKWNPAPAPRTSPSTAPRSPNGNGFQATIHRLREEARQKAYAGDIDGALAAAQRARKIAEASAGLVGDDPECTVEAANELVRKLLAIKTVAAKPAPPRPAAAEGLPSAPQHTSPSASQAAPSTPPPEPGTAAPIAVRPYGGAASLAESSVVLTSNEAAVTPARPFPSWQRPLTPFVPHPLPRVVKPLPPVALPSSSVTNPVVEQPAPETSSTDDAFSSTDATSQTAVEAPATPAESSTVAWDTPPVDVSEETEFVSHEQQESQPQTEQFPPSMGAIAALEESDSSSTAQWSSAAGMSQAEQAQPTPPEPSDAASDPGGFASSPEGMVTRAAWTTEDSAAAAITTTSLEATAASSADVPRTSQTVDHPAVSWEIPAIWFREVSPTTELPVSDSQAPRRSWARGILPSSPPRTLALGLAGLGLLLMGMSCFPTRRS